jgi:hypothetical protein
MYGTQLHELFVAQDAGIGRLAAVASRIAHVSEPAKAIAHQYFQPRWLESPLNRPESLEVHSHKTFAYRTGYQVNSWIRIRSAGFNSPTPNVVSVEQDLNTLDDERLTRRFSQDDVAEFFGHASVELDRILTLYFPNSQGET